MLETRFKIAILLTVLFLCAMPIVGIMRGTPPPPAEEMASHTDEGSAQMSATEAPLGEDMVRIPSGPFVRGTMVGGYDEQPERTIFLDAYSIDRFEVTNHHYQTFISATGHRKAAPPSRYAKNMTAMRGVNQPTVYVSWDDADAYCRWKSKRLPTEAEWEKAMRGMDGRLWPWGNDPEPTAANWASGKDGFAFAAPVGTFRRDVSLFGVADGAGNVMEWAADWYAEDAYRTSTDRNPIGPEHGTYRVLRGGGYTSTGQDLRITSRSRMVPDFRDETIGFRCAVSERETTEGETRSSTKNLTENQNSRG